MLHLKNQWTATDSAFHQIVTDFFTRLPCITLRSTRKPVAIGMIAALSLTAIALIPVAVAAYGISRGGIEAYAMLAAILLG